MNGIWKYSHLLPPIEDDAKLTLGEGNTPLVRSRQLGKILGLDNLYFKLETGNPSGSYKDRFAVCAIADLIQKKAKACIATSSGNTGSALSAYSAAAGIKCYLAIVDGAPSGKLQQMQVYGAQTLMIKDFGLDPDVTVEVMDGLHALARNLGVPVSISAYHFSPLAMAGVQTIAYEIAEEIPGFNGHIFSPVGGGGLTFAILKGFDKWKEINPQFKIPRVHCVQPEGNDTVSGPLRNGLSKARAVSKSLTSISGLQVPNVIDGNELIKASRASGATGYSVNDDDVYECQESLARMEGIYCEPAGAVALAGVLKAVRNGEVSTQDDVVCIVTGHGFKDPVSAANIAKKTSGHYFNSPNETFEFINSQITNKPN